MLLLTWPIFAEWIPFLKKPWWWYPLGILFTLFWGTKYFQSKQFFCMIAYTLVIFINYMTGDMYISQYEVVISMSSGIFVIYSAPYILFRRKRLVLSRLFFSIFVLLLIYTSVMSFIYNLQFPDVVRNDPTITGLSNIYELSYLYRLGLTKYQFAHAIPILIPPFVMAFRKENAKLLVKVFLGILIALCILHTYVSAATTPFLLSLIVLILCLAVQEGKMQQNKVRLTILSLLMLPLLINEFQLFAVDILDFLSGSEGSIHNHILELRESIEKEQSVADLEARQNFYQTSLDQFFSNPFWGSNEDPGNHSIILDNLAAYGLLGFIPLIAMIYYESKRIMRYLPSYSHVYFGISSFAMFFLLTFKQVDLWLLSCFLFVVVPILILVLSSRKKVIVYRKYYKRKRRK